MQVLGIGDFSCWQKRRCDNRVILARSRDIVSGAARVECEQARAERRDGFDFGTDYPIQPGNQADAGIGIDTEIRSIG